MFPTQHTILDTDFSSANRSATEAINWSLFLERPAITSGLHEDMVASAGKTILITGAAGSIGSALARQLMKSHEGNLLLLDRSRRRLDLLRHDYVPGIRPELRVEFIQADILSYQDLQEVFSNYPPEIVFHAAAKKHLAELEYDPFGALETNVLGTLRLLEFLDSSEMECFVNVSTDKAVEPTSILGVSKRIAELVLLALQHPPGRMVTLRLGNVLGSSGSVVPRFIRSMENNEPFRITDPQASRYFLTMEEAVASLVLALSGHSRSILQPDMGAPHSILELADFLLGEFSSGVSRVTPIFTGLQDGEKRCEQLLYSYEHFSQGPDACVREVRGSAVSNPEDFAEKAGRLLELVVARQRVGLIDALCAIVPEFTASNVLLSYVS